MLFLSRDTQTDDLLFYSSCDPFGTPPYGGQIFAMHLDGTGLRQLTDTQGYIPDGSPPVR